MKIVKPANAGSIQARAKAPAPNTCSPAGCRGSSSPVTLHRAGNAAPGRAVAKPAANQNIREQAGPHSAAQKRQAQPQASSYTLRPAANVGGGRQRIMAAVKGSHQSAGSVDMEPVGGGRVHVSNLSVTQHHRRNGVATQLVNAAINSARNRGFAKVSLEARPSDGSISPQSLVRMYQGMGFKQVGRSRRGNPIMERRTR